MWALGKELPVLSVKICLGISEASVSVSAKEEKMDVKSKQQYPEYYKHQIAARKNSPNVAPQVTAILSVALLKT